MVMMPTLKLRESSRRGRGIPDKGWLDGGSEYFGRRLGRKCGSNRPEAAVGGISPWNGKKG